MYAMVNNGVCSDLPGTAIAATAGLACDKPVYCGSKPSATISAQPIGWYVAKNQITYDPTPMLFAMGLIGFVGACPSRRMAKIFVLLIAVGGALAIYHYAQYPSWMEVHGAGHPYLWEQNPGA